MQIRFLDAGGSPIHYNVSNDEMWTQSKGSKSICLLKAEVWDHLARLGGVRAVPEKCVVVIQPTADNSQTIGVRYVVNRNGEEFVGFGSTNDFSTTKIERKFQQRDGTEKVNVSGSGVHSLEMATKRAKTKAIASALGVHDGEVYVGDIMQSVDFEIFDTQNKTPKVFGQGKGSAKPTYQKPVEQQSQPAHHSQPSHQQAPSSAPAEEKPKSFGRDVEIIDNPGEFILPFGKFKGQALQNVFAAKDGRSWLEFALKTFTDKPNLCKMIQAMFDKFPDLSKPAPTPAPSAMAPLENTETANKLRSTPEGSSKDALLKFWQSRNYTNAEAKAAIVKFLGKEVKWDMVTEADAKAMMDNKESMFPAKANAAPAPKDAPLPAMHCCVCNKELLPMEVKFCLQYPDKFKDKPVCFEHQ